MKAAQAKDQSRGLKVEGLPPGQKALTVTIWIRKCWGDWLLCFLSNNEVVLWAYALVPVGVCANSGIFGEAVQWNEIGQISFQEGRVLKHLLLRMERNSWHREVICWMNWMNETIIESVKPQAIREAQCCHISLSWTRDKFWAGRRSRVGPRQSPPFTDQATVAMWSGSSGLVGHVPSRYQHRNEASVFLTCYIPKTARNKTLTVLRFCFWFFCVFFFCLRLTGTCS